MKPKIPLSDFAQLFEQMGASALARRLGVSERAIQFRRAHAERVLKRELVSPNKTGAFRLRTGVKHPSRQKFDIDDGVILVGSDAHYWPGEPSTAHRAFVHMARKLNPAAIILNGDVLDGATVSRHPPISWEERPTLVDEIIVCQTRLREIDKAAPKAKKFWTLGNHDGRLETRIATVAPEFARIHGVHLKDHFGDHWQHCWSVWVNDDVVIKHRFKGGDHATHNNTLRAGKSMITGHLHSLKVTPLTDYNGTRWGVDTGTLAVPYGPQFDAYTENNPVNWRSGYVVLTFRNGDLLWPEVVNVRDEENGVIEFRGELIQV